MKVVILWWTKWFWEWLAKYIHKNFNSEAEILITGRDTEAWNKIEKDFWINFTVCNKEAVKNADVVIFSVPISITERVIEEVSPYLKEDVVMLDVTSIKKWPAEAMKKFAPKNALVIPTHPMFWPFITEISGQIIVLTAEEEDRNDKRYISLKNYLSSRQAKVVEVSSEEHDKMMSIVQWLTHFNMFVLAWTMEKVGIDLHKTYEFVSPIYKILVSSVWRYIHQNPWLYADIQMNNEENLDVYSAYLDTVSEFLKNIEEKDYESFVDNVATSKKYFWDEAISGQVYTDKIIHLIWKQTRIAKDSLNKVVKFENIYTGDILEDELVSFDSDFFVTKDNSKLKFDEWEIIK